ncbi:hypothetical protein COBT_002017, partial [Conglomerata obtusa]
MSKVDEGIDIAWNSRVVMDRNYEECKSIRVDKDIYLKESEEKHNHLRNIIYENKIAIDNAPIHSKTCHRLFLWVIYMKNYIESNEDELPIYPLNKCCAKRIVTNAFADHNAVILRELHNVLIFDLHKVM